MKNSKRIKELRRIQKENIQLLGKLQEGKSNYSVDKWDADYKVHSNRVKNIAMYQSLKAVTSKISTIKSVKNSHKHTRTFNR
jgi:hypothetical protein